MKDLALLVADKNAQFALSGALERNAALNIRPIQFEIFVHPQRDGGVRTSGSQLLAVERKQFSRALMVMDFEGSGTDAQTPIALESILDAQLGHIWGNQAKAIVIEPELDIWMWGSDNALIPIINWSQEDTIREWVRAQGFTLDHYDKPTRPKEALESALRYCRQPRSSALYKLIASTISLANCQDPAFNRLRQQLQIWFAA
jgi:hypothetical protein